MHVEHKPDEGRFEAVEDDGKVIGRIEYGTSAVGKLAATHARVDSEQRGKGIARRLLDAPVAYARRRGGKIVAVCPCVVAAFRDHPDQYGDVSG